MGFRFHKSFKIFPWLHLNISKSGISISLGKQGLTFNLGGKGGKATIGLPGSGMSYSRTVSKKDVEKVLHPNHEMITHDPAGNRS